MMNLEKYRVENGYYNATMFLNDYNEKHGARKVLAKFFNTSGIKLYMAELTVLLNSVSSSKAYNKNNIKMSKFGHDGYTIMLPELFAKYVSWLYKSFEKDAFEFISRNGYQFGIEDQEMVQFVGRNYHRYYGEKIDMLTTLREVVLCSITPRSKSFKREDVVKMNISMITSGAPYDMRRDIIYKTFL